MSRKSNAPSTSNRRDDDSDEPEKREDKKHVSTPKRKFPRRSSRKSNAPSTSNRRESDSQEFEDEDSAPVLQKSSRRRRDRKSNAPSTSNRREPDSEEFEESEDEESAPVPQKSSRRRKDRKSTAPSTSNKREEVSDEPEESEDKEYVPAPQKSNRRRTKRKSDAPSTSNRQKSESDELEKSEYEEYVPTPEKKSRRGMGKFSKPQEKKSKKKQSGKRESRPTTPAPEENARILKPTIPDSPPKTLIITTDNNEPHLTYKQDGYFPVRYGEILNGKYQVQKRIGHGSYACVWMAKDTETQEPVAVKIARCGQKYNNHSHSEIAFMKRATGHPNIVHHITDFTVRGNYGTHYVMVSEMLGPDLMTVIGLSNQGVLTVDRIKKFCRDILKGLDHLHRQCQILHLDLKPENIMMTVGAGEVESPYEIMLTDPACKASLKIGDLGLAHVSTSPVTRSVQTRNYRAPEAILSADIGPATDMWSFGCVAYELATRHLLFPSFKNNVNKELAHFAMIAQLFGRIEAGDFKKTERNTNYFEMIFGGERFLDQTPGNDKLWGTEIEKVSVMDIDEANQFSALLHAVMTVDPGHRLSAQEALEHNFLKE